LSFSLFSRLGGGRWEKRAGVMRGPPQLLESKKPDHLRFSGRNVRKV
jgi:hypothetical protein